jgi:hypothetical protein
MARTKALQNVGITYDGDNLQSHLNTASLEAVVETIDATTFASSAQVQGPGAPSFSISIGGPWSKALDDFLRPDAITPSDTLKTLVYFVGPSASRVTYTWTASGSEVGSFISNYTINADNPMGDVVWSGTLTVSGAPTIS